ncbi:ABC transporter ATP-binding protein [Salipaludibacillus daqingensis]|uniref:ABC transporter ATP-binding protein n=1 Tax=Salipaludibacillus daqingensis TaxID=3041001 RepID=UPI002476DAE6|nr:ABC transporter ATP-binding protein [Salipaludibacillus daqingensis]
MLIKVEKLTKSYAGQTVFSDLNLEMTKGEIMSLVGPSGCGKTTFLRCIAGLSFSTSGSIYVNDVNITNSKADERPVVLMFQQPLLFPHLTILENVTYGLKYGKNKSKKQERIERGLAILEKVELAALSGRYPNQLSGGQQQRVALARALILNPDLLLLDEPFSSLDPSLRSSIRSWVRDFLKKEGVTALFVTHDREEAMMMGDRIAVMKEGIFQQIGSPKDVYQQPKSPQVAEMFSEGLVMEGFFLSPDHLTLRPKTSLKAADTEAFDATVEYKILKYGHTFYHVYVHALEQRVVVLSNHEFLDGEQVELCYKRISLQTYNKNHPVDEGKSSKKLSR